MSTPERLKLWRGYDWAWDHPFPDDIGADGRWEISLYYLNHPPEQDAYAGYAALVPPSRENEPWTLLCLLEEENDGRLILIKPTLEQAKATLDCLLGINTPDIPADRDAADPWFGEEELHRSILSAIRRPRDK
jgi:hypothetical protein